MTHMSLAPHTARNNGPILDVLRQEFRDVGSVLEIGSGSGQHAVIFAADLDRVSWQTSDLSENHETIRSCLNAAGLSNTLSPLLLDVLDAPLPTISYDAVFSANTAHIMSLAAVEKMFALVALALNCGGIFCLYGPFRQNGEFNTDSNADFHASLRSRDSLMGIRHIEELDRFAASGNMHRRRLYAMPANNFIAVWQKVEGSLDDDA